nr:MAG TPA: hypothetical protein [Caudoviricetes sp.]
MFQKRLRRDSAGSSVATVRFAGNPQKSLMRMIMATRLGLSWFVAKKVY